MYNMSNLARVVEKDISTTMSRPYVQFFLNIAHTVNLWYNGIVYSAVAYHVFFMSLLLI